MTADGHLSSSISHVKHDAQLNRCPNFVKNDFLVKIVVNNQTKAEKNTSKEKLKRMFKESPKKWLELFWFGLSPTHQSLETIKANMIISQIAWVNEVCDQNGDRVSKNNKSCHICRMRLKKGFSKIWKIWYSVLYYQLLTLRSKVKDFKYLPMHGVFANTFGIQYHSNHIWIVGQIANTKKITDLLSTELVRTAECRWPNK